MPHVHLRTFRWVLAANVNAQELVRDFERRRDAQERRERERLEERENAGPPTRAQPKREAKEYGEVLTRETLSFMGLRVREPPKDTRRGAYFEESDSD